MNNATAIQELRNRREQLLVQRRAIDKELDGLDGAINVLAQMDQAQQQEAQRQAEQASSQAERERVAAEQAKAAPVGEPLPVDVEQDSVAGVQAAADQAVQEAAHDEVGA